MSKTKQLGLAFVFLVCCVLLAGCRNEGWFVNKSQPWYEGNIYHNTPHCGVHPYTDYITIMYDEDESEVHSYSSTSRSNLSYYSSSSYKKRGYSSYKRSNHTYMTMPVQKVKYDCYYS